MSYATQRLNALSKLRGRIDVMGTVEEGWGIIKNEEGSLIVSKRSFSESERKEAAKKGAALPDGSYPIENASDLKNAIRLSGMSNHSDSTVKAHIKSRAKALGLEKSLPGGWGGVSKAGIEVQDTGDPKHGVYEHSIAGQKIGHTVKAVADGSIAWTAVPTNGNISGKFKSQEDAKQYLADRQAEGMKQAAMEEQLAAKNAGSKPVKKDDEETGDETGDEAGEITKLDEQNESGESADDVEKSHQWTHFGPGGKRVPMSAEHKAKFEANKFKPGDTVAKMESLKALVSRITQ